MERDKIKGAIRTDFILSAEIIVIALGTVAAETLVTRIGVLAAVALLMTVAVYGFVAIIIKLDDLGFWLQAKASGTARVAGTFLIGLAPWLMRFLSVAGTAAMFLVGGGILVHGLPVLGHRLEALTHPLGGLAGGLVSMLGNGLFGVAAGALVLLLVMAVKKMLPGQGPSAG